MYIDPFVCGIIATILTEFILLSAALIFYNKKH